METGLTAHGIRLHLMLLTFGNLQQLTGVILLVSNAHTTVPSLQRGKIKKINVVQQGTVSSL